MLRSGICPGLSGVISAITYEREAQGVLRPKRH